MKQRQQHATEYRLTHGHYFVAVARVCLCLLIIMIENTAWAQSSDNKTSLVEQLRSTIKSGGAESASKWFQENWPASASEYVVDPEELVILMSEYLGAGDNAAALAVGEITASVMRESMGDAMNMHAAAELETMRQAEAEQQLHEQALAQKNQLQIDQLQMAQQSPDQSPGKIRDDLDRFKGLYGEVGGRQLFVSESCDGRMVAGPMWADVSPWWMQSVSDHGFTYADSFISLNFDFELDEQSRAVALSHDLEGVSDPLPRSGGLPPGFNDCIASPTR